MSYIVSKQFSRNGHTEMGWEDDLTGKIVQYFFQLVRMDNTSNMEIILNDILLKIKNNEFLNMKHFVLLYKLIGQTRDIIAGKGEQDLAFMQVWIWWQHYPKLAEYAFRQMVVLNNDLSIHPYGSWKDIKYWCRYIKKRTGTEDHPLIEKAIEISILQLNCDLEIYNTGGKNISLVSRWLPREKSSFGWIFKKIALKMNGYFLDTAGPRNIFKAKLKAYIKLKKQLTILNSLIDTPQIKMCNEKWLELEFNNITSQTLRRSRRSIMNLKKDNTKRSKKYDREKCAENYYAHREASKADPKRHKIHGKRASVYELVKDAVELKRSQNQLITEEIRDNLKAQEDSINLQWLSNKTKNKRLERTPIISFVDMSASMEVNNCMPLYNAIGLAIRTSELTHPALKNRILTFSAIPQWINLDTVKDNFVEKVWKIMESDRGTNANLYRALTMVLNTIIQKEIPPYEVGGLTIAVFSGMMVEIENLTSSEENIDTVFEMIEKMYKEAGLCSKFKIPFPMPHVLFWNLLKTNGFPSKTSQKNITFVSGYNSVLLNNFCNEGIGAIKQYTPHSMLENMLDNPRFKCLETYIMNEFA